MAAKAGTAQTSETVDALVQLTFGIHDVLARAAAQHNLSVSQLRLLGILRDRTPPMTAIAEHLGLDRSSVTGLVDRAQRRGLVSRSASPHDARVTIVSATKRGLHVARQLEATVSKEIEAMVQPVSDDDLGCMVRGARSVLDSYAGGGRR